MLLCNLFLHKVLFDDVLCDMIYIYIYTCVYRCNFSCTPVKQVKSRQVKFKFYQQFYLLFGGVSLVLIFINSLIKKNAYSSSSSAYDK